MYDPWKKDVPFDLPRLEAELNAAAQYAEEISRLRARNKELESALGAIVKAKRGWIDGLDARIEHAREVLEKGDG